MRQLWKILLLVFLPNLAAVHINPDSLRNILARELTILSRRMVVR